MVNLTERTGYYICNSPVDLRKGREGLADIVRGSSSYDPTSYDKAFIFYNKKYDMVKILHFDLNGYMILQKWFDDGKLMKPRFMEMKRFHHITREQAMFLLSNAVQSEIYIYDDDKDDQRAGGGTTSSCSHVITRHQKKRSRSVHKAQSLTPTTMI